MKKKFLNVLENDLFIIYFYLKILSDSLKNLRFKLLRGKNLVYFNKFNHQRKKDTLVILGTGASINKITRPTWDYFGDKCDTLGLNFWLINDFTPSFFMFEPPRDGAASELMKYWIKYRIRDFKNKNTTIILKDYESRFLDCDSLFVELKENVCILKKITVPGTNLSSLSKSFNIMCNKGWFEKEIWDIKCSLATAILFGYAMNYKKIILAGVDLGDSRHFYHSEQYKGEKIPMLKRAGLMHKTADPKCGSLTVDEVVFFLNDVLLEPRGISLEVMNEHSILKKRVKIFGQ